jgi:hypothetical protein
MAALRELFLDGWLLRFSEGGTIRANSVNPLWPGTRVAAEKILACEAIYAAQGQPAIFRLRACSRKVTDFSDQNMLQEIDFERILIE